MGRVICGFEAAFHDAAGSHERRCGSYAGGKEPQRQLLRGLEPRHYSRGREHPLGQQRNQTFSIC